MEWDVEHNKKNIQVGKKGQTSMLDSSEIDHYNNCKKSTFHEGYDVEV